MPAIDHATLAGADLRGLERVADTLGFDAIYGGAHANDETEMSLVVFPDGSYLELLAPQESRSEPTRWAAHLDDTASPCAWALPAPDIDATAAAAAANGIEVEGPIDGGRDRTDGTAVRWRFAFLGPGEPGAVLPFLIDDETPRAYRVPAENVTEAVGGLARVLVAVSDPAPVLDRFERALSATVDRTVHDETLDTSVHLLDGVAGAVVVPEAGPLRPRLDRYGDCVGGFLFEPGTGVPADRVGTSDWGESKVTWVGPDGTPPGRFGVVS
jgi:hypothetical protein